MIGALQVFGNIGILLFTYFGGPAFDRIGPTSPFIIVACGDWMVFALATGVAVLGYLHM